MSIKNGHVRWAFNLNAWRCTLSDLELATACIQPEEKMRLAKFYFLDDLKASLIGRLLMRRFVKANMPELDYNTIRFERDERQKPYFPSIDGKMYHMDFNVSHHEGYAVLAGSFQRNENQGQNDSLGVDVMTTEFDCGKDLNEFFRLMQRKFSKSEWECIKSPSIEAQQAAAFMRFWSLKESYVKNIGVGITVDLEKINFQPKESLSTSTIARSTSVSVNGSQMNNWVFEESLLDHNHCVAVAVKNPSPKYLKMPQNDLLFEVLDFNTLTEHAQEIKPLLTMDTNYCKHVLLKEYKIKRKSA